MVDIFEHCTRLDTATVEERRDLVQVVPDGGKLPCDGFDLVRPVCIGQRLSAQAGGGRQLQPVLLGNHDA